MRTVADRHRLAAYHKLWYAASLSISNRSHARRVYNGKI